MRQKMHPLLVPGLLAFLSVAGIAWSLWSGAPGIGGGILAGAPVAVILWKIRHGKRCGVSRTATKN